MDDRKLVFVAIISSVATCGLLIPLWIIVLSIYFIVKAFTYKPPKVEEKPKPKVVLPDNSFAEDWTFVIKAPSSIGDRQSVEA